MTDISSIVAAPRAVDIKHPGTGEKIGLRITLLPASHEKVRAEQRKLINERLNSDSKPSAEKIEANRIAMLEAAVDGWEWQGDLTFEGKKPDFTLANLRAVLGKLSWLRDQIDAELGNEAAFFLS